jgi:hypothetical protein
MQRAGQPRNWWTMATTVQLEKLFGQEYTAEPVSLP